VAFGGGGAGGGFDAVWVWAQAASNRIAPATASPRHENLRPDICVSI